jgi:hypothetical protein
MDRNSWIGVAIVFGSAALLSVAAAGVEAQKSASNTIEVYKTPTCGCCSKWVDHLKANGVSVRTTDLDDLDGVKKKYAVPVDLGSCHTAVVSGYVVEGHVPATDVRRLLKERPKIAGIAVPSMPAGSPGMEVPSGKVQPYRVLAFDKKGKTLIYASHGSATSR